MRSLLSVGGLGLAVISYRAHYKLIFRFPLSSEEEACYLCDISS